MYDARLSATHARSQDFGIFMSGAAMAGGAGEVETDREALVKPRVRPNAGSESGRLSVNRTRFLARGGEGGSADLMGKSGVCWYL